MPSSAMIELNKIFDYSSDIYSFHIHWTSIGSSDNPPLVFVHGTPWSSVVWHTYAKSLSQNFHVYLFDNPGFGKSPLGEPLLGKEDAISRDVALDGNLSQQSKVFSALYEYWKQSWDHDRAHVIAHDHGGLMALRAHLLHGCEYRSLCLIDVVALGPWGQPLFKLVSENEHVFEAMTGPVFEGIVESYIRDAAHKPLPVEIMEMLKQPWISNKEGRKGFVRQMVQANSRSTSEIEGHYHEVGKRMPVKIIWGKEDKWIPAETAEKLRLKLNGQSATLIDEAGHLVMYDQEGALGIELAWWLRSVS